MTKRKHQFLPASRLYKTAEEIVDGYGLYVDARKNRKVTLIGRPLRSGNVSLFRYYYQCGHKVQEKTGAILMPEKNSEVKADNKRILSMQQATCDEFNAKIIRRGISLKPTKNSIELMSDYIEECKGKLKPSFRRGLDSLNRHLTIFNPSLRICDFDVKTLRDFIAYLRESAVNLTHKDSSNAPHLKANTQLGLLTKLSVVLNHGASEEIIAYNPFCKLSKGELPKAQDDVRAYLSKSELKQLIQTPYLENATFRDVPKAFLFACFTGLRYSDVVRLTGDNIGKDDGGEYIMFEVKKTRRTQKLYLNKCAKSYLPKARAAKPLFHLPSPQGIGKDLRQWARKAGINKAVTFHVARHTCATLMLSAHVPLEVVSNQLGHKSIRTTQRYAKITGENQRQGVSQMARFFNL